MNEARGNRRAAEEAQNRILANNLLGDLNLIIPVEMS